MRIEGIGIFFFDRFPQTKVGLRKYIFFNMLTSIIHWKIKPFKGLKQTVWYNLKISERYSDIL